MEALYGEWRDDLLAGRVLPRTRCFGRLPILQCGRRRVLRSKRRRLEPGREWELLLPLGLRRIGSLPGGDRLCLSAASTFGIGSLPGGDRLCLSAASTFGIGSLPGGDRLCLSAASTFAALLSESCPMPAHAKWDLPRRTYAGPHRVWGVERPVSYTHLTLPTICSV